MRFIALYDAPWRDLQLAGFAGGMILGVSQRFLPFIYGFREVPASTAHMAWWLWNVSVAGNMVSYLMFTRTGQPGWGIALEIFIVGLFAAVVLLVRGFGLFSIKVEPDRSLPFLKAAYCWCLVAIALLALLPAYDAIRGVAFSHAYFGGYRHLFTVGFISMMILGVSSKIVPILGGLDPHRLSSLRATFWLVNVGNAMRVLFQILTDSQVWAYPLMGLSAWVELTGLTLWAIDLWRAMGSRPAAVSASRRVEIGPQTKVYDVIHSYPETKAVFQKYGFSLIENLVAQRVFARSLNLEQVCRLKHVDFAAFQSALKKAVSDQPRDGGPLAQIEEP